MDHRAVAVRQVVAHEDRQDGAAVERRQGEQVEDEQEQVHQEQLEDDPRGAGIRVRVRQGEPDHQAREDDEQEVHRRSGRGHDRRPLGIAVGPVRIVGGARPTDDAAALGEDEVEDGHHHHPPGLATDVRHGVEGDLATLVGGGVSELQGGEGVAGLMERGRKDEDHEQDETFDEDLGAHARYCICC